MSYYERRNTLSHLLGVLIFCILGTILIKNRSETALYLAGNIVYVATAFAMFFFSSIYHAVSYQKAKKVLRVFDHSAIFLFIAGSYTPFVFRVLDGKMRIIFISIIYLIAIAGLVYKGVTFNKFDKQIKISVILYVIMGWMSVFLVRQIYLKASTISLVLLIMGGITYTIGTYFYKKKNNPLNHVIWHYFVLAGAVFQYFAIYFI